jgi:stage II sporulation protein AB (anti-sigma F factor)
VEGPIPQAEQPLALELPAVRESVTQGRRVAARFAESVGADPAAVELAVGEAIGNAVLHAYRGGEQGTVDVEGRVGERELVITVGDAGVGMRPDPTSRGLGFGVPLIAQLSDGVEITGRAGGGTEIRMRFAIGESSS